jgi:hypothetical protein
MAYNAFACGTQTGNTGLQQCTPNMGVMKQVIIVPKGFKFDTEADALTLADWQTAINASLAARIYPMPQIFGEVEDQSEGTVYQPGSEGNEQKVREGREKYMLSLVDLSMYNYLQLRKHNNKNDVDCFIVYSNGFISGSSSDGVVFEPRQLSEFTIEKRKEQTSDALPIYGMKLVFASSDTFHENGAIIKPTDWNPLNELFGIKDVELTVASPTTSGLTVTVKGKADGIGVEGLVAGDFTMLKGTTPVVVTLVEVGNGVYTLSFTTTAGAHTLNLANQPAMTTKFFESVAAVAVTIS